MLHGSKNNSREKEATFFLYNVVIYVDKCSQCKLCQCRPLHNTAMVYLFFYAPFLLINKKFVFFFFVLWLQIHVFNHFFVMTLWGCLRDWIVVVGKCWFSLRLFVWIIVPLLSLLCTAKGVFSPVPPYSGYFIPSHFIVIMCNLPCFILLTHFQP